MHTNRNLLWIYIFDIPTKKTIMPMTSGKFICFRWTRQLLKIQTNQFAIHLLHLMETKNSTHYRNESFVTDEAGERASNKEPINMAVPTNRNIAATIAGADPTGPRSIHFTPRQYYSSAPRLLRCGHHCPVITAWNNNWGTQFHRLRLFPSPAVGGGRRKGHMD